MPHRHTVYCKHTVAEAAPEMLLRHLRLLDFSTLGEDCAISEEAVRLSLPPQIKNDDPGRFRLYHLFYGKLDKRPVEIDRWETHGDVPRRRRSLDGGRPLMTHLRSAFAPRDRLYRLYREVQSVCMSRIRVWQKRDNR